MSTITAMLGHRKRRAALMAELKVAYTGIDAQPYKADPDRMAQAVGHYDGMRRAYVLLTGRREQDVAHEVVHWYIGTPEYQASKDRKTAASGG